MKGSAAIEIPWPDEPRKYRLRLSELRELQEKCGERGPERILSDIISGDWKVDDLYQIIRLGLIGAGMDVSKAMQLAHTYVIERPLYEAKGPCQAILLAALVGPPRDVIEEPPAPPGQGAGESTTGADASGSPSSSETGPLSSAGLPNAPSSTASGNIEQP
jgi:hypothetical protein